MDLRPVATRSVESGGFPFAGAVARTAHIAAIALMAGCTVMQPITAPENASFFPRLGTDGQPQSDVEAAYTECASSLPYPGCFVGGLGEAIRDVDARRMDLVQQAAGVSNTTASFNALLWPVGGAILLDARTASTTATLTRMAILAAAYGFLSSGVPEREKFYLQASHKLFCAIANARPDLYGISDFGDVSAVSKAETFSSADRRLVPAIHNLKDQIDEFSETRVTILRKLHLKPTPQAALGTVTERRIAIAQGKAMGSGVSPDTRPGIEERTRRQYELARTTLREAEEFEQRIRRSGSRLRALWIALENEHHAALAAKVPPLSEPTKVIGQLASEITQLKEATKSLILQGSAQKEPDSSATANLQDPHIPEALRKGLDRDSLLELANLENGTYNLLKAVENIQRWIDRHSRRAKDIASENEGLGCGATAQLSPAVLPVSPPTSGSRDSRTTPATPGSGSSPASGTPLPSANR
jgi:hypothetical protein